jgi:putative oxidoreductase
MKRPFRHQPWIGWTGRLLLGSIFIYAAILKMDSPQDFADNIAAFRLLPDSIVNLFALGLPLFELACGLFVLTGLFLRIGLLGILSLLALFMGALTLALLRGLSIDCGCFGALGWLGSNPWVALFRDAVLLGVAVFVYRQRLRMSAINGRARSEKQA